MKHKNYVLTKSNVHTVEQSKMDYYLGMKEKLNVQMSIGHQNININQISVLMNIYQVKEKDTNVLKHVLENIVQIIKKL